MKWILCSFLWCAALLGENTRFVIVFDFGGVLVTADKTEFCAWIAESFSIPLSDVKPLLKQMRKVRKQTGNEEEAWKKVAGMRRVTLPANWMEQCVQKRKESIFERPKMMALVRQIKAAGYRVAMLSNVSKREAVIVRELGYYAPFDPALLSCEIGVSKPKKKAFTILLHTLGKPGKEVIFIDDQQQNVQAASQLGIDAIHFISYEQLITSLKNRNITLLTK